MLIAKTFYFFFFAAGAFLFPFLVLYYESLGFTGRQIGLLTGLAPLVSMVSSPLWSGVADATQRHKLILMLTLGGTLVAVSLLSVTTAFALLIPVVCLYAFFQSPVIPLSDNAVLDALGDRRSEYGRQRLWGAIGWGISAVIAGQLTDKLGLQWSFHGYLMLMFVCWLVVTRFPMANVTLGGTFFGSFRRLMRNREWRVLIVTVFIVEVSRAIVRIFLFLHLNNLHAGRDLMGLSLMFATLGEIPVFFYAEKMLTRWGPRGLLTFSIAASVVQALCFSMIGPTWLVLPFQMLHGPAFSAGHVARINYAKQVAPPGLGATAQGILASVSMGLAGSSGAVLGGVLYDAVGAPTAFRISSGLAFVGLCFFRLMIRREVRLEGGS